MLGGSGCSLGQLGRRCRARLAALGNKVEKNESMRKRIGREIFEGSCDRGIMTVETVKL